MQLPVYTPQVQKTAGGDARLAVPHNIGAAAELAGQGINALNKGVGAVNAVLFKQAADADKTTATAANNEYTQRLNDVLYNDKDGLLHTQMKGADGITSVFEEKEKQIRDEIAKKYKFNFNAGRQEFDNMAKRTYGQRMTNVQNHMYAESKKYRDVTFSNAIDNQARFAADNYADAAMVEDAMAGALANVDNYYAGQGTEVVEQQRRRIAGQLAQQVINRAYAQGDYLQAEAYLNKYGFCMDSNQKTMLQKNISERIQTEKNTSDFISLAQQYSDFPTFIAKVGELYDHTHVDGADAYNMPTQGANIDEQVRQLTPEFRAALPQIGGILKNKFGMAAVISSGGRTVEHNAEVGGAEHSHHIIRERGGDAVDIVLPDETTAEQAKKVLQYFENSGAFAEVLFHDAGSGYHLHLGGYRGGLGGESTPASRQQYMNAAIAEWNKQRQMQNMYIQSLVDAADEKMYEMTEQGIKDPKAYYALSLSMSEGNPKAMRQIKSLAKSYSGVSAKSGLGGSKAKATPGFKEGVTEMLLNGVPVTKILDWVGSDESVSSVDADNARKLVREYKTGKGVFKYDFSGVKQKILDNYKDKDKEYAWRGVQDILIDRINKYRDQNNGKEPDPDWVVVEGTKILMDPISYNKERTFYTSEQETQLYKLSFKGILNATKNPRGGWNLELRDHSVINVTDAQFAKLNEDSLTVEQAINEG